MSERKKGVVLSYIQVIISIIVNIVYVPILLKFLGKGEYGLHQLVGSFFSYINIFEACMSNAVLRNYCDALAHKDRVKANSTLYIAKKIYQVLGVVLMIVGIGILLSFRSFYYSSLTSSEIKEGTYMLVVLFVNMFISLNGSVYTTMVVGNERFVFFKGTMIVTQVIQPFLVFFLVRKQPYAIMVTLGFTVVNVLCVLCRYIYSRKLIGPIKKCRDVDKTIVKQILSLSSAVLLGTIADQIFWKADQVILGKLFNTAVIAVYSVGAQIYMIYMQFGMQIANVFYPRLSALYAEENGLKRVSDLFIKVGRLTLYILLLILTGFILFGKEFLQLWVGQGYEEAYYIAIIVMIPFSIDLAQNLGLVILQIVGQYNFRAKIYFVSAFLNIFTTIILAARYGIIGAAVSTGLSMLITNVIIMNIYYKRKTGLDINEYWKQVIMILLMSVLLMLMALFVKSISGLLFSNVIVLSGGILVYICVYVLLMYFFVMNNYERELIRSVISTKFAKCP